MESPIIDQSMSGTTYIEYAGFWTRFVAALIDGIFLGVINFTIAAIIGANTQEFGAFQGITIILQWLYFALMESSANQATLGKMALGIKVVDLDGERISFGKATGRYFGKIVSAIILLIGYIMAAFTEKKQALHDMMAGTLVIKK